MCRHGRGKCVSTCLVYATCAVAFVVYANGDKFSVMYLILLYPWCMGIDEARAYLCALCTPRVSRPLLHTSMVIDFLLCTYFYYTGGAWAWTRQAPWYLPCGEAVCVVCREFAACVYISLC